MSRAPSIKGRQLLRLLIADGWEYVRDAPHGKWLRKRFRNETRFTTVKDDNAVIPAGTLSAILGPKQTGLGRRGLRRLIKGHL